MAHQQVMLFVDDPALERVLGELFPDAGDAGPRAGSLEEVRGELAVRSVAVITAAACVRTAYQRLSGAQREQLLGRGRTAAVILLRQAVVAGPPSSWTTPTSWIVWRSWWRRRPAMIRKQIPPQPSRMPPHRGGWLSPGGPHRFARRLGAAPGVNAPLDLALITRRVLAAALRPGQLALFPDTDQAWVVFFAQTYGEDVPLLLAEIARLVEELRLARQHKQEQA